MNASDQVQEYLEGMKIIKSCGLSGVHFKSLDNALLATPAMEGKEKEVSNCDIELSHVTFAYNQENVIKDISCKIPQGSVTALVGPSGSGKSTLAGCINGLNPFSNPGECKEVEKVYGKIYIREVYKSVFGEEANETTQVWH